MLDKSRVRQLLIITLAFAVVFQPWMGAIQFTSTASAQYNTNSTGENFSDDMENSDGWSKIDDTWTFEDGVLYGGTGTGSNVIRWDEPRGTVRAFNATVEGTPDITRSDSSQSELSIAFLIQDTDNSQFYSAGANANMNQLQIQYVDGENSYKVATKDVTIDGTHDFQTHVSYNGSGGVYLEVTDLNTSSTYTLNATVDPESAIGDNNGYLGLQEWADGGDETAYYNISATTFSRGGEDVSGRVVSCPAANPDCEDVSGVPDGTVVQAYGVRESNINTSETQTLTERAQEIRDEMRDFDPEQIGWDPDLALTGSDGTFQNADAKYVAVHNPSDWALTGWTETPTLGEPKLTAPADRDIILSVWDPSDSPMIQDGLDKDLPGTVDDNTDIQIQQLDYSGDVVDTRTVSTSYTRESADFSGAADHDYARVNLPPGFYRVSPEGSSVGYVITVGDPQELTRTITEDLETEANQLSDRAQEIRDLRQQDKVVRLTTYTYTENGTSGHYDFAGVPDDVNVVAVQAYSPSADEYQIDNVKNASLQDLREVAALDTYNGSFVVTPRAKDVDVPSENARLKAVELDAAPFMDPGRFQNKSEFLEELFTNSSFSDQIDEYLDTSDENMTEIRDQLEEMKDQNSRLQDRYQELLNERYDGEDPNTEEQVRMLRQAIQELQGSLQPEDPSTGFENGKASATIPWSGDVDPDAVSVTAHFPSLGVSQPVPDEYVSVNKRVGQGDVVNVENYPVPEDAASVNFGVTVSGEDGENIGDTNVGARNPDFTGEFLNLKSMSATTLRPGASEQVTVTPHVSEQSALIQSINATVTGPDGEELETIPAKDGDAVQFTTDGAGSHRVKFDITDRGGNTWTETVTMKAHDTDVNQPPSVRAREGFTGTFAVVGDGLVDGSVSTNGLNLGMTGVADTENVPSTVHFYGSELSNKHPSTTLNVMKASGGEPESIRKHVTVFYHTAELPEDSIIYREGNEPLKVGGTTSYGTVTCGNSSGAGCTVETYTDASGSVDVTVNTNPSIVDRAFYWVRLNSPVDLPFMMIVPDMGLFGDVTGAFGGFGGAPALTIQFQPAPAMADVADTASGAVTPHVDAAMTGGVPA